MTIPISREIQMWSAGHDARMSGQPRDDGEIDEQYKRAWIAGWDEADEVRAADPYDKGLETADAYIIYDASGNVIKR